MKQTRVPRASLAVSILRDPDYIALVQTAKGRQAFAVFTALVMLAKDQGNGGRFVVPAQVVAAAIHMTMKAVAAAVEDITAVCRANGAEPWLLYEGEGEHLVIRNYKAWNQPDGRGGARLGAGRPIKEKSIGIQTCATPQVGIGNGIGSSLPEGGAGGNPTPADRYCVRDIWARLKEVVPANRRPGQRDILDQLAVLEREGVDLESVISPASVYYQTPVSRSNRGWGLLTFLRGEHHTDDPSAWVGRDEEPTRPPDPLLTRTPAEDAEVQARILRERALR